MKNLPTQKADEPTIDLVEALKALRAETAARQQAEEELKRYRERLKPAPRKSSSELLAAKKLAKLISRMKSVFLANMSHEMYTPLNAILGYAQILKRDTTLNERQIIGINAIQQSGEQLLALINEMLDLSKAEEGKLQLHANTVEIPAFLKVIADVARQKAEQKNLAFSYQGSTDLPTSVEVDEKRLRNVLISLLENAIKFTDRGEISFKVNRLSANNASARICFEITDTSSGKGQKRLQALLQAIENEKNLESLDGMNLGMVITKPIIQLMGGDIYAESDPGKGNRITFELSLPITTETTSQQEQIYQTAPESSPLVTPPYEEMQILYVLALAGNMRDIRQWADHLVSLNEQYKPFAEKLKKLANDYQSQVILNMVEDYMRGN